MKALSQDVMKLSHYLLLIITKLHDRLHPCRHLLQRNGGIFSVYQCLQVWVTLKKYQINKFTSHTEENVIKTKNTDGSNTHDGT